MNIGIIGTGKIGGTLARRLSQLNHSISIANSREPETLTDLATEINGTAGTVYEAARDKDVVIIAIPQKSVLELPDDLFANAKDDLVIIDTCNYYPLSRDGVIYELEQDLTSSGWVQAKVKRPIVKTFNSVSSIVLRSAGRPKDDRNRIALPVSGDRKKDKAIVADLLDQLGFDFFDAGELENSWKYEPGAPAYGKDYTLKILEEKLNNIGTGKTPELKAKVKAQREVLDKQFLAYQTQQKQ